MELKTGSIIAAGSYEGMILSMRGNFVNGAFTTCQGVFMKSPGYNMTWPLDMIKLYEF